MTQYKRTPPIRILFPFSATIVTTLAITFSLSPVAFSQPNNNVTENASDIDWVSIEELSEEQRTQILDSCCGLYIEPELPSYDGPVGTLHLSAGKRVNANNSPENSRVTLEGNIEIFQLDQLLQGNSAVYNRSNEVVDITGNVRLRQPGMLLASDAAHIDMANGTSELNNASYVLHQQMIRGSASIITYTDKDGVVTIDNGLYTRCEPADNSWVMGAEKIILDQEKGRGIARNATLRIKDIPVLYTPYISFPMNDNRTSGFLAPSFGSTSDGGVDISTPYYFNLAPNYDATFTPRVMSDRGVMLSLEGRYKGKNSDSILNLAFLPNDKLFDTNTLNNINTESPPEEDRWLINYDLDGQFNPNLSALINYTEVSDQDYFRDLGDIGLNTRSLNYLRRNAQLNYLGKNWNLSVSSDDYQVLSLASSPYNSLPRINLNGFFNKSGFEYGIATEYVHYEHALKRSDFTQTQINNGDFVSGQRLSIEPKISYPWRTSSAFVIPTAKLKYASYQLSDQNINFSDNQSRSIIMTSIDSGLIFERDFNYLGDSYTQTLEPRAFYLYNEYEDQSQIPVFDSIDMTFSSDQLFRENRFSGKDRIADSNQMTLAVTSQFLNDNGQQKAKLSLGQIFYFEDRRVTSNNLIAVAQKDSSSSLAGEISYQFNKNWKTSSYMQWSPHSNQVEAGSLQFRYQSDSSHILNLSYRYRDREKLLLSNLDNKIAQTDISGIWPLTGNWGIVGRWNYDHANSRILETVVGLEYDTCCWSVQAVAREWIDQNDLYQADIDNDTGMFFQFELKGLGNILGTGVSSILTNGISGYRAHEYAN